MVVRVGSTVRRPTGPWTATIHALLRHLGERGYRGAPRVLGIDDRGREILTYVDGDVVWPDNFALISGDEALSGVARMIRAYHYEVATFDPPGAQWSDIGLDPVGAREIFCHNDLAPWNLIRTSVGWTFIDWDLAAPGRLAWDLSWAMIGFVPLFPGVGSEPSLIEHRIEVFCRAYGAMPLDVIDVAAERAAHNAQLVNERGAQGEAPWARVYAEGHGTVWEQTAIHIASNRDRWNEIVSRSVR